jgi:hypothetical protein
MRFEMPGRRRGILLCRRLQFRQAVLPQDRQDVGASEGDHDAAR